MWLRAYLTEGACVYCVLMPAEVIDHVVPVSLGGTNDPANLVGACERCNAEKGDRTPSEWFDDVGQSLERALLRRFIERPPKPPRLLKPTIQEQFEVWFDTTDPVACWVPPGPDHVSWGVDPETRRQVSATRWAYKHFREEIGKEYNVPGRCLHQTAMQWRCVNPWHREAYPNRGRRLKLTGTTPAV